MRIVGKSRYLETKEALLDLIGESEFPNNKLPSEDVLAKTLGISVATVREALRQLNREGYITKKHGSGNYIHRSALDLAMRIDIHKNFFELLSERYDPVRSEQSKYRVKTCTEREAKLLRLEKPERCLYYDRYYYVQDSRLAIFATNVIPTNCFTGDAEALAGTDSTLSLMEFIWEHSLDEMVQTAVHMQPENARAALAERMALEPGRAMTRWQETFYNVYDVPLALSEAWFHPDLVDMTLLIKW